MPFMMRSIVTTALIVTFALGAASCGKPPTGPGGVEVSNSGKIDDYVGFAQLAGAFDTKFNPSAGSVPSSGGGPSITVRGQTTVNSSTGVGAYAIDSPTPFSRIYVTATGKTGYIQIDLPSSVIGQGFTLAFGTLPATFTLQFQAATSGGAVGPAASLPITAVASKVGTLVASARPSGSLAFNGKTCTIPTPVDPTFGCTYETRMDMSELGGSTVNITQYEATWTYGGTAGQRVTTLSTLPGLGQTQIPASSGVFGIPVFLRCSTPTCDPAFYAPTAGTMFFTITGTDSDGHAINFKSQTFTLLAGK
jgi:hypothetical protein